MRLTVGGAGDPGGRGRRRIGPWRLTALALCRWQSLSSCQNIGGRIVCTR